MISFSKEIQVNEYKDVRYSISKQFVPIHMISATDNSNYGTKQVVFYRWNDYSFTSWYAISALEEEEMKVQSHTFEKYHPLYVPLLHLLNGEDELIIDDDEMEKSDQRYMRIFRDGNNINIDFVNNLEGAKLYGKFSVFVKNVLFDDGSKIDRSGKDTKERLYFFFKEMYERINEEQHQITMEEYLINNDMLTKEETKKYVKKLAPNKSYDSIE